MLHKAKSHQYADCSAYLVRLYTLVFITVHLVHIWIVDVVGNVLTVSLHTLVLFFASYDNLLVFAQTCTSWDEVTADNVLLHTLEEVNLTTDSTIVKNLCRLLE